MQGFLRLTQRPSGSLAQCSTSSCRVRKVVRRAMKNPPSSSCLQNNNNINNNNNCYFLNKTREHDNSQHQYKKLGLWSLSLIKLIILLKFVKFIFELPTTFYNSVCLSGYIAITIHDWRGLPRDYPPTLLKIRKFN